MDTNSFLFNGDSDESALFRSSIALKRKATETLNSETIKNAKLSNLDIISKESIIVNDKSTDLRNSENHSNSPEKEQFHNLKNNSVFTLNDSISDYFKSNKLLKNKCLFCSSILECSTTYFSHIKKCAKKNKVTTKQLLIALESKKKLMKNDIGSSLQSAEFKPTIEKKSIKNYLTLNPALPKNLSHYNQNSDVMPDKFLNELNSYQCDNLINLRRRNKKKIKSYILLNRTKDDRQRIITEKAAVILLDENNDKKFDQNQNFFLKSNTLKKYLNKVNYLWNLSENEKEIDWYVDALKDHVIILNRTEEIVKENDSLTCEKMKEKNCLKSWDFYTEIPKLNLPEGSNIDQNWREMINNKSFSDLTAFSKDDHAIYLHKLVLNVRCPDISEADWKSILKRFNWSTNFILLEYLYCGTLNYLEETSLSSLIDLARSLNFKDLSNILYRLEKNLSKNVEECLTSSRISGSDDFDFKGSNGEKFVGNIKKQSLFEGELINIAQNGENSGSYRALLECNLQNENLLEKTSAVNFKEEKIHTDMKEEDEVMEKLLKELETKESIILCNVEDKISAEHKSKVNTIQNTEKNNDGIKSDECCIILSSDSDSEDTKNKMICSDLGDKMILQDSDYDVPYFDPYENYNDLEDCNFSPIDLQNRSLGEGDVSKCDVNSFGQKRDEEVHKIAEETVDDLYQSTEINSSEKKLCMKSKKRRSDSVVSRILRKSLHLNSKSPKSYLGNLRNFSSNKKSKRKKSANKDTLNEFNGSLTDEIIKSPTFKSSTPTHIKTPNTKKEFVEVTPWSSRGIEIEESVTPYPEYSGMDEALLRDHLAKYGLKRNLGRKKAQKILKHIYEELHPYLNKQTGKLVRKIILETPKNHIKKTKATLSRGSNLVRNKNGKNSKKYAKSEENINILEKEKPNISLDLQIKSSKKKIVENSNDIITPNDPNNVKDLHFAMIEFLKLNPDLHEKILLYEPIWVHELQLNLKKTFNKHYKMEDLVNYLDQKCITFRTRQKSFKSPRRKMDACKKH